MTTKIRGFSADAKQFITDHPGTTAQEVYRGLRQQGKALSAAQNPEASLVATLHKHHKDIGVERRYEGGSFRYYPKGSGSNGGTPPSKPTTSVIDDDIVVVAVRMRRQRAAQLDAMAFANPALRDRSDAANFALDKVLP